MAASKRIVTIDGPSGGGKSTVSRALAAKLRFTYLDTGAMYRAVAYQCLQDAGDPCLRRVNSLAGTALLPHYGTAATACRAVMTCG